MSPVDPVPGFVPDTGGAAVVGVCPAGVAPVAEGTVDDGGDCVAGGEPAVEGVDVTPDTEGDAVALGAEEAGVEPGEAVFDAGGSDRRMASICATEG